MFGFSKKIFIGLLTTTTSVVNVSSHAKRVSLSNQKCTIQPIIISLHPIEYTQGLRYPFSVDLDRCQKL